MRNLYRKLTAFLAVTALMFIATPCFAEDETVTTIGTSLAATAASVATAAGVVIVAGLAIFGLVWGVKKLKSAISSGA
jgi:uncharacterized membrane protein YciS (DUF1049 family)